MYVAPLQRDYSEALPTANYKSLDERRNYEQSTTGRPVQVEGVYHQEGLVMPGGGMGKMDRGQTLFMLEIQI